VISCRERLCAIVVLLLFVLQFCSAAILCFKFLRYLSKLTWTEVPGSVISFISRKQSISAVFVRIFNEFQLTFWLITLMRTKKADSFVYFVHRSLCTVATKFHIGQLPLDLYVEFFRVWPERIEQIWNWFEDFIDPNFEVIQWDAKNLKSLFWSQKGYYPCPHQQQHTQEWR